MEVAGCAWIIVLLPKGDEFIAAIEGNAAIDASTADIELFILKMQTEGPELTTEGAEKSNPCLELSASTLELLDGIRHGGILKSVPIVGTSSPFAFSFSCRLDGCENGAC